jgi:hypothetical protein
MSQKSGHNKERKLLVEQTMDVKGTAAYLASRQKVGSILATIRTNKIVANAPSHSRSTNQRGQQCHCLDQPPNGKTFPLKVERSTPRVERHPARISLVVLQRRRRTIELIFECRFNPFRKRYERNTENSKTEKVQRCDEHVPRMREVPE